jgi:serine/threonine protein kinase
MEHFDKSLKERISSRLLVKQQKTIMRQLLLGLQELKSKNIIHRDLKPDNIMMRKIGKG